MKTFSGRNETGHDFDFGLLSTTSHHLTTKLFGPALLIDISPHALYLRDFVAMLSTCLRSAESDPRVRAIVFSQGLAARFPGELEEGHEIGGASHLPLWLDCLSQLYLTLLTCSKTTVGIFSGDVSGAQLVLSLSCDRRVGSTNSRMIMPSPREKALSHLLRFVLESVFGIAADAALLSHPLEGEEALRHGLLHKVVARNGLLDEGLRLAVNCAVAEVGDPPARCASVEGPLRGRLEELLRPLRETSTC